MRGFTTSEDGRWLYLAEGGMLRFIETLPVNPPAGTDFELSAPTAFKSSRVGTIGVLPIRMRVDPSALTIPGDLAVNNRDLIYIAGGRDGLWAMEADTRLSHPSNLAWRIDSSGDSNPNTQQNRRACVDVATMTLGGTEYLLALFAKKNRSHLRIYPISAVLNTVIDVGSGTTGQEMGREMTFAHVILKHHPSTSGPGGKPVYRSKEFGRSVAIQMDVHERSIPLASGGTEDVADVYVAMGHHGIARVRLRASDLSSQTVYTTSGTVPGATACNIQPQLDWGPLFGSGTPYIAQAANAWGGQGLASGYQNAYGDVTYGYKYNFTDGMTIVERLERPFVTAVRVLDGMVGQDSIQRLYVAADTLFWMSFDISDPDIFSDGMPIEHQQGTPKELSDNDFTSNHPTNPKPGALNKNWVMNSAGVPLASRPLRDYVVFAARDIELQQVGGVWYVAVTATGKPFIRDFTTYTYEGFGYGHQLDWGLGYGSVRGSVGTFIYEAAGSYGTGVPDISDVTWGWIDAGGDELYIAPDQSLAGQYGAATGKNTLMMFHNTRTAETVGSNVIGGTGVCLTEVDLQSPLISYPRIRDWKDSSVRIGYWVGTSMLDPETLLLSGNDGHGRLDGIPRVESTHAGLDRFSETDLGIHAPSGSSSTTDSIEFGPNALMLDRDSQWQTALQATNTPDQHYVFCNLNNPVTGSLWGVMELDMNTTNQTNGPPGMVDYFTMQPGRDRFNHPGRNHYQGGSLSRELDGFFGPGQGLLFSHLTETAEGVFVIDRESLLADGLNNSGPGKNLVIAQFGGHLRDRLVTHPEFNWMDHGVQDAKNFWNDSNLNKKRTNVTLTGTPKPVRVNDPQGGDAWIIAVPCGFVNADIDWTIWDGPTSDHPEWFPTGSIYDGAYNRGLIQFFRLGLKDDGPDGIQAHALTISKGYPAGTPTHTVSGLSPLPKILLDPLSNAWRHETLELGGKVYLFTCDYGGRLYVHEIQDILSYEDPSNPDYPDVEYQAMTTPVTLPDPHVSTWVAPLSFFDQVTSAVHDVVIDETAFAAGSGKALVYASVRRVGVVVFEFDPSLPVKDDRLRVLKTIRTPGYSVGLELSDGMDIAGQIQKALLVNDYGGAIRVYVD